MNLHRVSALFVSISIISGLFFTAPIDIASQMGNGNPKVTRSKGGSEKSLTGEKAVDELKQSGGYESLNEAFKKASGMSLSDPEPANLLPGGSYEETFLAGSDSATADYLGFSVAISEETAVIGAGSSDHGGFYDPGAAYVFVRAGSTWTQQAKLVASDAWWYDYFGISVAISGDTIVVGSLYDDAPAFDQGSAYVFVRSGNTWTQQQKLTASDGAADDTFGLSVAISGDTLVVGAYRDDVFRGSAYVFTRSGGTWTQQQKLTASDGAANDRFGQSVAISGDTAVIGAVLDDVGSNTNQGSAYVFTGSGGTWTEQQKLVALDGAANDQFGVSVAVSVDTVVVGAPVDDIGSSSNQGSAYVFTRSGGTWTQQANLVASDGAAGDQFGYSVAVSGNTAVVGAPYDDSGAISDHGSAYRFTRSGSTWTEQTKLLASDGAANDEFGVSVAVSGDTIVIGVHADDVASRTNQGSARIFQTKISFSKILSEALANQQFGQSISISGNTAVIGATGDASYRGAAYVFVRNGAVWSQQAKILGAATGNQFGKDVGISGDTIVVGAPGANSNKGAVFVHVRSGSSWTLQQRIDYPGESSDAGLGYSVDISGDLIVAGAWQDDIDATNDGSAFIYRRTATTWTQEAAVTAGADAGSGDLFGYDVSISGSTVVVGAPYDRVGTNNFQGSAWVFTHNGTNWWTNPFKLTVTGGFQFAGDFFGSSVSIDGDVAVIGAQYANITKNGGINLDQGAAYVFNRSAGVWTQTAQLTSPDGVSSDRFGGSVEISSDLIVIGAVEDQISFTQQGSVHVFEKSGSQWIWQRKLFASDGAAADTFGSSVAVDGSTIGVGTPLVDNPTSRGAAYLYYWGPLRATAGGASLSGRVLETNGRGLANATVVLTDSTGVERTVQTGSFGRFSFSDLPSGETYVVSVRSRRFVFAPQVVSLQSDLSDVRLEASGRSGR